MPIHYTCLAKHSCQKALLFNATKACIQCIASHTSISPAPSTLVPHHYIKILVLVWYPGFYWVVLEVQWVRQFGPTLSGFWDIWISGQVLQQLYLQHCLLHLPVGPSIPGHSRDFPTLRCLPSDYIHWQIQKSQSHIPCLLGSEQSEDTGLQCKLTQRAS